MGASALKVDTHEFHMKPIGQRPRPRILTTFGRVVVIVGVFFALSCAVLAWRLLK